MKKDRRKQQVERALRHRRSLRDERVRLILRRTLFGYGGYFLKDTFKWTFCMEKQVLVLDKTVMIFFTDWIC